MLIKPYGRNWFVVLGFPIHRAEFFRLCSFIMLAVSFVVGFFVYLSSGFITEDIAEKVQQEFDIQSDQVEPQTDSHTLDHVMKGRLGEDGLSDINSLQLNGTFRIGKQVFELSLFSKRPNLCKVQLKWPEGVAYSGFDGTESWSFAVDSFVEQFALMPEILDRDLTRLLAMVLAGEWTYSKYRDVPDDDEDGRLPWETEIEWQGRSCHRLLGQDFGTAEVYHYFNPENASEVCREASVSIGGIDRLVLLYYSKPMESGYPLPSGFELWIDGRMIGKAKFTDYEVNRGLMDYLFSCPEKAKDEEVYAPLTLSGGASQ